MATHLCVTTVIGVTAARVVAAGPQIAEGHGRVPLAFGEVHIAGIGATNCRPDQDAEIAAELRATVDADTDAGQ